MIAFPNAKINIGLQIVGKRSDGYHDLETVFYPIALHDVVEVVEAEENTISLTGLKIPSDTDNICTRAYSILQSKFNLPPVHIHLHKAIPMGAGLGGGSADAAFLIKVLNDQFELGLNVSQMQEYARLVGADCAFFIENKASFATGRGDWFEEVNMNLDRYSIVVVKPDIHVSTAEAFKGINVNKNSKQLRECIKAPVEEWRDRIVNDFEVTVFDKYPAVREIKDDLYHAGAIYASMSGSGSAVFGIFESQVTLTELEKDHLVFYC